MAQEEAILEEEEEKEGVAESLAGIEQAQLEQVKEESEGIYSRRSWRR